MTLLEIRAEFPLRSKAYIKPGTRYHNSLDISQLKMVEIRDQPYPYDGNFIVLCQALDGYVTTRDGNSRNPQNKTSFYLYTYVLSPSPCEDSYEIF